MTNLTDVVGGANLFGGSNYYFAADRFNNSNSAIYFKSGYLQVPSGVYFSGDFTITAWIKLNSYANWQRIIDFGNGDPKGFPMDNVFFAINGTTGQLDINTVDGNTKKDCSASMVLQLNQWYFVAYVLQGYTGVIYVNGANITSCYQNQPNNVVRSSNYVGKSWYYTDAYADATYDDLKLYNNALKQSDILKDYINTKA